MGFSSKTDVFGFLGFRIWDTYIGLLGISMWINLWCGLDGVCSDGFRRFRRFGQTVQTVQTVCSDDIVMGEVGLLGLAAGWSSWVGRYILLINPVDKTVVWWVVFPGRVKVISRVSSCGSGG